ncbi:MAG: sensor histidine kinase, partial [Geminicoccales bacterium]
MIPRRLLAGFDALSVRNKILAGYASLVVPFLVLVVMTGIMSAKILTLSRQINDDSIPVLESLQSIRHYGVAVIEATNTIALVNALGPDATARSGADIQRAPAMPAATEAMSQAVRTYEAIGGAEGGGDPAFHDNIEFAHDDIIRQSGRIVRLSAEGAPVDVLLRLRDRFERSAESFRSLIGTAIDAERAELAARQNELNAMAWLSAVVVIAFGVAGIGSVILGGLRVSEHIAQPIRRLRDAALRIGDGEFDHADEARTSDEVGELVDAFRTMVQRLKDSMVKLARQERLATLGQLAGTVSHELRNPLGAIRNSLFSLRECLGSDGERKAGKVVDRIERNIERCDAIVSDLLDYARGGAINPDTVEFNGWLAAVLDEHVIPTGITLHREFDFDGFVPLDRERFRQVLVNLLDNAVQAIDDPDWQQARARENAITVRTEAVGPFLQMSVADTGPGIAPAALPKVFEPLFTTKSFGVGLGLPMVRQIVTQHGGTIDVASEPGCGATFLIRIPRSVQTQE